MFHLPAGVELDLGDDTLSIKFDGDVTVENTLGRKLGNVEAGGDLVVATDANGTLSAGGKLVLKGRVEAEIVRGGVVHLEGGSVKARSVSATSAIHVGNGTFTVDVMMAPNIEIDPKASGRVTVIESDNDRGPTNIKGGFSLAEYEELFGDATAFLAERGLERAGDGGGGEE